MTLSTSGSGDTLYAPCKTKFIKLTLTFWSQCQKTDGWMCSV